MRLLNTLKRWFKRDTPAALQTLDAHQQGISDQHISAHALKVLHRLQGHGFEAYLVGGCVRDLLVGLQPKDFDVATNATPEQVRQLFNNSRMIGRRFRIVHVLFGRETIEVTTFRGHHLAMEDADDALPSAVTNEEGMLLSDNVYGSLEEDAIRRDFTINALYYNPEQALLKGLPQGFADIQQRCVRIIGDAETRYREDPVRMLRALRFACKLNFTLEPATAEAIRRLHRLLGNIAPARLFDEAIKLFHSGQAHSLLAITQDYGLFAQLFPSTQQLLTQSDSADFYRRFIEQALRNTDARLAQNKSVTPAFLYAVLLWPCVIQQRDERVQQGQAPMPAFQQAVQHTLTQQSNVTGIPKRFAGAMRDIWELQYRLTQRSSARAEQTLAHPRFRAAYDFVLLREQAGETLQGLGAWWTQYQQVDETERLALVAQLEQGQKRRSPRRRRRRSTS